MDKEITDIIVKSWNAIEFTLSTLSSIRKHTHCPYKITVVDNGSDHTAIELLEKQTDINLIKLGHNFGPGGAAKVGFENITSKYFVLMDNDVLVTENWLERLLADMGDNVGAVAPLRYGSKVLYPNSNESSREVWEKIKGGSSNRTVEEQINIFTNNSTLEMFEQTIIKFNNITKEIIMSPPGFVSTSLILLNRKAVNSSGGISDDIFKEYGGEDVDLCWRLGESGFAIVRSGRVYVHHFEHGSMVDNKTSIVDSLKKSNLILYKKWGSKTDAWKKKVMKNQNEDTIGDYPFIKIFDEIKNGRDVNVF